MGIFYDCFGLHYCDSDFFIIIRLATRATKTLNTLENINKAQSKQIALLQKLVEDKLGKSGDNLPDNKEQ